MDENLITKEWTGTFRLSLAKRDEFFWELEQQTELGNLLRTLAPLKLPEVAHCALDIIFQLGHSSPDTDDALEAYAISPLPNPPQKYLDLFHSPDCSPDYQTYSLYAIVLAGSKKEEDIELLLQMLSRSRQGMNDAVLCAASASDDPRIVAKVAELSMIVDDHHIYTFMFCFGRWLKREVVTLQSLYEMLKAVRSNRNPKRLLEQTICYGSDLFRFRNDVAELP